MKKQSKWVFRGDLKKSIDEDLPEELITFVRWMVQGTKVAKTDARQYDLHRSCLLLSHQVLTEFISPRQMSFKPVSVDVSSLRNTYESPFSIGLALQLP